MKLGILVFNILFKGKLYYARFPLSVFSRLLNISFFNILHITRENVCVQ